MVPPDPVSNVLGGLPVEQTAAKTRARANVDWCISST